MCEKPRSHAVLVAGSARIRSKTLKIFGYSFQNLLFTCSQVKLSSSLENISIIPILNSGHSAPASSALSNTYSTYSTNLHNLSTQTMLNITQIVLKTVGIFYSTSYSIYSTILLKHLLTFLLICLLIPIFSNMDSFYSSASMPAGNLLSMVCYTLHAAGCTAVQCMQQVY